MSDLEKLVTLESRTEACAKELERTIKPAGYFGLPKLLDERRLKYGLPNGFFTQSATYDRLIVAQVAEREGESYLEGGKILMTQKTAEARRLSSPRGIIVSAGLKALDILRSNGMDIGHMVRFIRNAPYRFVIDTIAGEEMLAILLRVGDIVSSEDLEEQLRGGAAKVSFSQEHGVHLLTDTSGKTWVPKDPWTSDDT